MHDRPFLERLSPADRAILEQLLVVKKFTPGEIVVTQEEVSSELFFVLEGLARATVFSSDGKMISYRDLPIGAIFGEIAAIDHLGRSASVVSVENLVVGVLSWARFRDLVDKSPAFNWALLQHLAAQSRIMTERIFEFSTMLVHERLVQELLRLARSLGAEHGAIEIKPAPTHFDLAARISTHREAVSREMSKLAKKGLVSKRSGGLILHDLDALRALQRSKD